MRAINIGAVCQKRVFRSCLCWANCAHSPEMSLWFYSNYHAQFSTGCGRSLQKALQGGDSHFRHKAGRDNPRAWWWTAECWHGQWLHICVLAWAETAELCVSMDNDCTAWGHNGVLVWAAHNNISCLHCGAEVTPVRCVGDTFSAGLIKCSQEN